jgi:ParE toxin of type II toxin-antitoxin system, parDE
VRVWRNGLTLYFKKRPCPPGAFYGQEAVEMLLVFPDGGRDLGRFDARRLNLRGFSYHLIYRVEGNMLVIYAIAHHKRSPNYWLSRLI